MSERIEVNIESPEGLEIHSFRFWMNGFDLILDEYVYQTRETRRHKYLTVKFYDRLKNNRRLSSSIVINIDEVPFPNIIQKMAIDTVVSQLKVYKSKKTF